MKTITFLVNFLIFIAINASAQGWQWISTGYNYILMDISFPPGQNQIGFAVGENITYNGIGIILKTTDGGDTWQQVSSAGIPGLEAVCFTDENTGYIGGWQNFFAKTTDGGQTWIPITVDPSIWYIKEIDFTDNLHGIVCAAGAQAFVTADGGVSWTAANGFAVNAEDLDYASPTVVYAVGGDEIIARSTDGGYNWTTIYTGQFMGILLGVDFYDTNYGVVGGEDGKVLVTANGGQSWSTNVAGGWHLFHGVHVFNTDSSLVAGTPEGVYKTTDGGTNWVSDFNGGTNYALYKIVKTPDNTLFISGSQGMILRKKSTLLASFTVPANMICSGSDVQFSDQSSGNVVSWQWSFTGGNPSSSTLQNPIVNYPTMGAFDVELTVSDGTNSSTSTQPGFIQAGNPDYPAITGASIIEEFTTDQHQVVYHPGSMYQWVVQGGTILNGGNTHQVTVQWESAGTAASLIVTEENQYHCMASDQMNITLTIGSGTQEFTTDKILVFPQPASVKLNLSNLTNIQSITLCDLTGRSLLQEVTKCPPQVSLDVSTIVSGLYLLRIVNQYSEIYTQLVEIVR